MESKVDEAAEKLYDLVKSEKIRYRSEHSKKGEKAVHVKSKRPTESYKKNGWLKTANNNKRSINRHFQRL